MMRREDLKEEEERRNGILVSFAGNLGTLQVVTALDTREKERERLTIKLSANKTWILIYH